MSTNDHDPQRPRLRDTPDIPDRHTALVVGHLRRRLYTDILKDEQPERLKTVLARLKTKQP